MHTCVEWKVGARTCKFYVLIMFRLKVMPFGESDLRVLTIPALLDCVTVTSIQANLLRFTQTLLIDSVGKRKVGAQTCKFQALIVIRSEVMSFRTHAQILQK